jgi:hypothetical protein
VFNTTACSAMTLATVVDVRLAAGTEDDRRAAIVLSERIPRSRRRIRRRSSTG